MIKTIDDLRKCYAVRADKEVFELFMDKCEEFGVKWSGTSNEPRDTTLGETVVFSGNEIDKLTHGSLEIMIMRDYKRLTLSDFKPTQTEYVQVTESIFDLKDEFERGDLYVKHKTKDKHYQIVGEQWLISAVSKRNIYRRVEKEIDWQDELKDYFFEYEVSDGSGEYRIDSDEFLEVCRVALRANGELEG